MIDEISLAGLGVVRQARAEFAAGFTAVTGETGAGKTLVLSGIGMLLGARADAGVVDAEVGKATSSGRFVVPAEHPVVAAVRKAGGDCDDIVDIDGASAHAEVLITRAVATGGRSKAHVGGAAVPVKKLSEIAANLVTVHGQADQLRLKHPDRQRDTVDAFAGSELAELLATYQSVFREHRGVCDEIERAETEREQRAAEAMVLKDGLEAISDVNPMPGEEDELLAAINRLDNVEGLRSAADTARGALAGADFDASGSAIAALEVAHEALRSADDPELNELAKQVASALYTASDAAAEAGRYLQSLSADPATLARHRSRLAALRSLQPRYGTTDTEILAWAERAVDRLAVIDESPEARAALLARRDELAARRHDLAMLMREHRVRAGEALAQRVTDELTKLAMPGASLHVRVAPREEFALHGADTVELLLAPHPGATPAPLGKGASGGELSRVMLALEIAMAGDHGTPTFIFDEIDAGVGGSAATAIGERLAALAAYAQVIVVTHLPQVAAWADQHLVLVKNAEADRTETSVTSVTGSERVRELARMLAGQADSASAQEHAEELLAHARDAKSSLAAAAG